MLILRFYTQYALWVPLCLALVSPIQADELALIQNVRIQFPKSVLPPAHPPPSASHDTSISLPPVRLAAGQVLLHRYGCTTCHQLDIPTFPQPGGPALDAIAHKVSEGWLRAWLEDPFTYLPASKMPRVLLGPEEREHILAFMLGLSPNRRMPSWPDLEADPYKGADLFAELQCQQCHRVAGEGGQEGPGLDRLGHKTSRRWLYAFLKAPRIAQPGTASHGFHLVDQEALDLSEYLARRFAAGRDLPDQFIPVPQDSARTGRGLTAAVEGGCFQCHAIESLTGPRLSVPVQDRTAAAWLDFHQTGRGNIPAISIPSTARQALALALQTERGVLGSTVADHPLPADYWRLPVPDQGAPPQVYSPETHDLSPEACTVCHLRQGQEWQRSRHARSLSPGLLAQLVDQRDDPALIRHCLSCHAPLTEQYLPLVEEKDFIPGHGVTCAGCHVRSHRRFGPPFSLSRSVVAQFTGGQHGVAVLSPAFRQSAFCAPCHQFDAAGLALNGKLLQNTHREWAASPQGRRGETCQNCHMPDGRHLGSGIHDPGAVRQALELEVDWQFLKGERRLRAEIRLHNRGAGHHVPTYVTPALFVKVFLADVHGSVLDDSLQIRVVQRRVRLDENREVFDTRIPAAGAWVFDFAREVPPDARFFNLIVEVDPDFFYRSFFDQLTSKDPAGAALIQQAHAEILDSPYILFVRTIPFE